MFGRSENLQGSRQPRRIHELNLIFYPADRKDNDEIQDDENQ